MLGLVAGSYLFAECSNYFKKTIDTVGDRGKITLHTLLRINRGPSVVMFATVVLGILLVILRIGI